MQQVCDLCNIHKIEPLQKQYLVDNLIDGIRKNKKIKDKKHLVLEAPTGSGKTYTIVHRTIFEIIKNFDKKRTDSFNIFFLAPTQECVDEPYDLLMLYNYSYADEKKIRVYDSDTFKAAITRNLIMDGNIRIFVMTTQFFYRWYENSDFKNLGNFPYPDFIINDEAHRGLGVPDASTTKEDKGSHLKDWEPKWYDLQHKMLEEQERQTTIVHLTATPTQSQRMMTIKGADVFIKLPVLPKSKESNTFTRIDYFGNENKKWKKPEWEKAFEEYLDKVEWSFKEYENFRKIIPDDTWKKMEGKIDKMAPGVIIQCARQDSDNGVTIKKAEEMIKSRMEKAKIEYDLFISTSKKKSFGNKKIKRMSDGIILANSPEHIERPLIVLVVESGKMGINIPRLHMAAIFKRPSQQKIHNNQTQFVARTGRLPFFRDHDAAIDYIRNLDIFKEQKAFVIDYYTSMCTSFVFMPNNSELMNMVEEFYTRDTFNLIEGSKYVYNGVFGNQSKKIISGYRRAFTREQLDNSPFRKQFCEAHPKGECKVLTIKGYDDTYGKDKLGDSNQQIEKSLQVDHKDGNRYNNHPSNLITVCPNVHMFKTQRQKDYLNTYPKNE